MRFLEVKLFFPDGPDGLSQHAQKTIRVTFEWGKPKNHNKSKNQNQDQNKNQDKNENKNCNKSKNQNQNETGL